MNKSKVTTKEALEQYDRIKRGSSKNNKNKLCRLCKERPVHNKALGPLEDVCLVCHEEYHKETAKRDQERVDGGSDSENYCGGY